MEKVYTIFAANLGDITKINIWSLFWTQCTSDCQRILIEVIAEVTASCYDSTGNNAHRGCN